MELGFFNHDLAAKKGVSAACFCSLLDLFLAVYQVFTMDFGLLTTQTFV